MNKDEYELKGESSLPLEIHKIQFHKDERSDPKTGSIVAIRPCAEKYNDETFLGIYIGCLSIQSHPFIKREKIDGNDHNTLHIYDHQNPAIYVFKLKKIIYGIESYWKIIRNVDEFEELTDNDIENVWYVKLLKKMAENEQDSKKSQE